MSEDDSKRRVRVEVVGDPAAIFKTQARLAAVSEGITKAFAEQIAAINERAFAAVAASIKPSIDIVNDRIAGMLDVLKPTFARRRSCAATGRDPRQRDESGLGEDRHGRSGGGPLAGGRSRQWVVDEEDRRHGRGDNQERRRQEGATTKGHVGCMPRAARAFRGRL